MSDPRPRAARDTALDRLLPVGRTSCLVLAGLAVALGGMVVHLEAWIALVVPGAVGVLFLAALVRLLTARLDDPLEERRILWWTLAAFAAHLVVGLLIMSSTDLRSYLATDSFTYHASALDIVRHWDSGLPLPLLPGGKEGFYYLLAGIYWVFGPHTSAGVAVNAMLAAALVPIVTDTTERLFGRSAARPVPPLMLVAPSILVLTSGLLKEAVILFLVAVAVNGAVRITHLLQVGPLLAVAGSLALLFTFRAWVALVLAQGLFAGVVLGKRQLISALGTGMSVVALLAVLVVPLGLGYSGYQAAIESDLEQANLVRQDLAVSASSGFAPEADISTSRQAVSYLPEGLVRFSLGPFPWQVSSVRQLPALADALFIWAMLPSLWVGLRVARRRIGRQLFVAVLPALATSVLLALSIGNYGAIARERMQVLVVVLPVMAFGLVERRRRRRFAAPPGHDLDAGLVPA